MLWISFCFTVSLKIRIRSPLRKWSESFWKELKSLVNHCGSEFQLKSIKYSIEHFTDNTYRHYLQGNIGDWYTYSDFDETLHKYLLDPFMKITVIRWCPFFTLREISTLLTVFSTVLLHRKYSVYCRKSTK